MHYHQILVGLGLLGAAQAAMYTKNSPVVQVDGRTYDKVIAKSGYTSIVEFYAPWCGHCQNLKPAYEKAAKNLDGLAQVAAVNCDDDDNKPLCGQMGIQGFPTLKIVRPSMKPGGRPSVEDYNGPRTATGIVEAVVDKINNHVKRVTDKDIDEFLESEGPKAILFTEKGTTSALLKAVAIDFRDVIEVAQVRSKEEKSVEKFNVGKFPTLVLVPGGDKEPVVYDGEMKKAAIVSFLSQAGEPNSGKATKKDKPKAKKEEKKPEEPAEDTSEPESPPEPSADDEQSTPPPKQGPPPIPTLMTAEELTSACLFPKSGTCVLALVPEEKDEAADALLETLAELVHKNAQADQRLFPFYAVPAVNPTHAKLAEKLELEGAVNLVAVNPKRGWWRAHEGGLALQEVAEWVDAIRLSEGTKRKLPEGVVEEAEKEKHDEL